MTTHAMPANEARQVLTGLQETGVRACLSGGWGVDALLGRQTRVHSDLDLWAPAEDLHELLLVMVGLGIDKVFPWPDDRPWNWVLHDGHSRRVDLHLYEWKSAEHWHYGSAMTGETFPAAALAGTGLLDGLPVSCEAPAWALRFRTGYPPRDVDRHDIGLLCERFELDPPQD